MTTEQLERFKRYGIPIDDGIIRLAQIGDKREAENAKNFPKVLSIKYLSCTQDDSNFNLTFEVTAKNLKTGRAKIHIEQKFRIARKSIVYVSVAIDIFSTKKVNVSCPKHTISSNTFEESSAKFIATISCDSFSAESAEFQIDYNTDTNSVVADFWVIDKEKGLRYLGSGKSSSAENKIAHNLTPKEIKAATTYLKNMRNGIANSAENTKIINDRFKNLEIQSVEEQDNVIFNMCTKTKDSGFEYGTQIAIRFLGNKVTLEMGLEGTDLQTSKSKEYVKFRDFVSKYIISIAIAHTHLDNCDLSAMEKYGTREQNDVYMIEYHEKPYVVVNAQNPSCREVGYLNRNGKFTSEKINSNILEFVLSTYKER